MGTISCFLWDRFDDRILHPIWDVHFLLHPVYGSRVQEAFKIAVRIFILSYNTLFVNIHSITVSASSIQHARLVDSNDLANLFDSLTPWEIATLLLIAVTTSLERFARHRRGL